MYEIQRIKTTSLARIMMLIAVVVYVVFGLLISLAFGSLRGILLGEFAASLSTMSFFLVWLTGTVAVIPCAFLLGLVVGAIYNVTSRWWGGLRIDLVKVEAMRQQNETPVQQAKKQDKKT